MEFLSLLVILTFFLALLTFLIAANFFAEKCWRCEEMLTNKSKMWIKKLPFFFIIGHTLMYIMRNKEYLFIILVFNNLDLCDAQQRLSIYYTSIKQPWCMWCATKIKYLLYLYVTTLMYVMRNKDYLFSILVLNNLDVYDAEQRLSI